jgi:hypothetical protein
MTLTVRPLVAVLLAALPAYADAPAPAAPTVVPFEMLARGKSFSGHIAVQVMINDKGPYRLIFDTGAPTMLLTTKVAKECGLIGAGAKKPAIRSPFALPGQVTIGKLEVGGVTAKDLPAIVLDHPTVAAIADMFGPVEGIVGFPFFARFRTSIDYQAKQFTFEPNGYRPADVMQTMMAMLMTKSSERSKPLKPRMLTPAAQWGLRIEKKDDDDEPGVLVAEVLAESAAAAAGIKVGDRLLTLDGRWTDSVADGFAAASYVKAGQGADVTLRRGNEELRLRITPQNGF